MLPVWVAGAWAGCAGLVYTPGLCPFLTRRGFSLGLTMVLCIPGIEGPLEKEIHARGFLASQAAPRVGCRGCCNWRELYKGLVILKACFTSLASGPALPSSPDLPRRRATSLDRPSCQLSAVSQGLRSGSLLGERPAGVSLLLGSLY